MKVVEFLRRKEGLSQTELGAQVLYGRTAVSRLESGQLSEENIHPRFKDALERRFRIPFSSLIGEVPDLDFGNDRALMDIKTLETAGHHDA